jgi:hypothetical protein
MRHPLRSAVDLFRSRWWSIGWGVVAVAFAPHVAALTLAPISVGQAVLAGGLVFLAVLAERFFGFDPRTTKAALADAFGSRSAFQQGSRKLCRRVGLDSGGGI